MKTDLANVSWVLAWALIGLLLAFLVAALGITARRMVIQRPGGTVECGLRRSPELRWRSGIAAYRPGQPVTFLVTGKTPLGYSAIVENAHRGLLYHDRLSAPLQLGQKLKGFIRALHPGGRLDLSLDATGYKRVAPFTERIVQALEHNGGHLAFDDDSPPEAVREAFGCSKKAFKQALGALYKSRRIQFNKPGIQLLDNTTYVPSG